jgi:hypothetical protein
MIDPDTLAARLDDALESGEMTDEEAREEWLAARDEALEAEREEWDR